MISTPSPPDPFQTATAQSGMNRDTALTQQQIGMVNQNNPWGSVGYEQTGTQGFTDSQGNWVETPTYTQTTSLSPQQQRIFNQSQQATLNLAQLARQQSARMQDYLGGGIDMSGAPDLMTPNLQSGVAGFDPNFSGEIGGSYGTTLGSGYANTYAGADDFSADRQRYEDALWQRGASDRAAQEDALRNRLINSGIRPGSAAWNSEMERMQRQNTDAWLATTLAAGDEQARMVGMSRDAAMFGNESELARLMAQNAASMGAAQFGQQGQALSNEAAMGLAGFGNQAQLQQAGAQNAARQQHMGELFGLRNQPINELSALMSGSQVSNPAAMGAALPAQPGVGGVDYSGLVNQQYQAQVANSNAQMGGLFGLGSSIIGAIPWSDARLKTDVRRVGTTDGGTPIYTYRYVWGGPVQMGVMAQDVPEAAVQIGDYLAVDYSKVA